MICCCTHILLKDKISDFKYLSYCQLIDNIKKEQKRLHRMTSVLQELLSKGL